MPENTDVTTMRLDRRTVVRTAANALWAVPAIQLATSVPAFAAASGAAVLSISGSGVFHSGNSGRATVTVNVGNTGGEATVALQITFSMPAGFLATVDTGAPAGWSITPPNVGTAPGQAQWTLTRTGAQLAQGASTSFALDITKYKAATGKKDTASFDLTATGTTTGGTGTSALLPVA